MSYLPSSGSQATGSDNKSRNHSGDWPLCGQPIRGHSGYLATGSRCQQREQTDDLPAAPKLVLDLIVMGWDPMCLAEPRRQHLTGGAVVF